MQSFAYLPEKMYEEIQSSTNMVIIGVQIAAAVSVTPKNTFESALRINNHLHVLYTTFLWFKRKHILLLRRWRDSCMRGRRLKGQRMINTFLKPRKIFLYSMDSLQMKIFTWQTEFIMWIRKGTIVTSSHISKETVSEAR